MTFKSSPARHDGPPAISRAGRSWRIAALVAASIAVVVAVAAYAIVSARATDRGGAVLGAAASAVPWNASGSELGTRGTVEVGGVSLTSSEIQCGLPKHDWQGGSASAAGQFCVVDVEVRNESASPILVAGSAFELTDSGGARAAGDEDITAYDTNLPLTESGAKELPLGSTARIHLVFDLPASASAPMELRFAPAPGLQLAI